MAACGASKNEEYEQPPAIKRMFNFKPAGKRADTYKELPLNEFKTEEDLQKGRKEFDETMSSLEKFEMFKGMMDACETVVKTLKKDDLKKIGVEHDADVVVYVHKPKHLPAKGNPVAVFNHGGGQVVGSAKSFKAYCCCLALRWGVVIVNVEYRLAPHHKNKGHTDVYAVVKSILADGDAYFADPKRICVAGQSGGSHTASACINLLAKRGEAHLVKLVLFSIPMWGHYMLTTPEEKLIKEEKAVKNVNKQIYTWLAGGRNGEKQLAEALKNKDPAIFPDQASDDLLKKWPRAVIISPEFCFYNNSAQIFAKRLEKLGKLAEMILVPGEGHTFEMRAETKLTQTALAAEAKSVKVHLNGAA